MAGASKPGTVSTKQQRIAELAQQAPSMGFTSLNHHLDLVWLVEAYNRTRKDGAPGVDGQTAVDYGVSLLDNLTTLLDQAKSGTYRAPPVRRVRIPKGTGTETRPLGVPTLEDKILQRAVVMALEPIYEQDFLGCSYGFRPGRSAHQALAALWQQTMDLGGCWLLEVDIRIRSVNTPLAARPYRRWGGVRVVAAEKGGRRGRLGLKMRLVFRPAGAASGRAATHGGPGAMALVRGPTVPEDRGCMRRRPRRAGDRSMSR